MAEEETPIVDAELSMDQYPQRRYKVWAVFLIFIVPALGGLNFGYDIGATSFAVVQMESPLLSGTSWFDAVLNSVLLRGMILSFASAGALLGSTLTYAVADRIGRKTELQIGSFLYLLGASLQCWSGLSMSSSQSMAISILLIGRLIYGLGIGVTMHAAPTYLAEMGPADIRGILVSLKEACIVLGILVGYSVGYLLSNVVGGWPWIYAFSTIASLSILCLSTAIPRSSRWLLLRGRHGEALASLTFLYDHDYVQQEFDSINASLDRAGSSIETRKSIWESTYRAPLIAGIGLVVLQQITGQPSVLSYSTAIFRDAGLADYAGIVVALFKLLSTLGASVLVEIYGRKKLLISGCVFMLVALVALTCFFGESGKLSRAVVLLAMFVYIAGYQIGFGPITWLLTSELYPLQIRGQAVAFAVQTNFFLNMLVQFAVPLLDKGIGLRSTFAVFACLTAYRYGNDYSHLSHSHPFFICSIVFVMKYVPETKGRTLEEIERQFTQNSRAEQFAPSTTEALLST